jgi:hypothetical protein
MVREMPFRENDPQKNFDKIIAENYNHPEKEKRQ